MAITASSPSIRPSFSAIVPNYNDGARIGRALASLAAQTVAFDEILVVDDGSTDDSVRVIDSLLGAVPGARLLRLPRNQGVVAALNAGIAAARGSHLFLASANDSYSLGLVEHAAAALARRPEVFLCGNIVARGGGAQWTEAVSLPQRPAHLTAAEVFAQARARPLCFPGGATILSREALLGLDSLDPTLRWNSDWFVHCYLALSHGCAVIPETLATVESTPGSYSWGMSRWPEQRQVTLAFLERLRRRHADHYDRFRDAAVLPRYSPHELALIAGRRDLRPYLTPLLARRCFAETGRRVVGSVRRRVLG